MYNPLVIRLIAYPIILLIVAFFLFGCSTAPKTNRAQIDVKCSEKSDGPIKGFFLGESLQINILKGSCEEL